MKYEYYFMLFFILLVILHIIWDIWHNCFSKRECMRIGSKVLISRRNIIAEIHCIYLTFVRVKYFDKIGNLVFENLCLDEIKWIRRKNE